MGVEGERERERERQEKEKERNKKKNKNCYSCWKEQHSTCLVEVLLVLLFCSVSSVSVYPFFIFIICVGVNFLV